MNNTIHKFKKNPETAFLDWFNNFLTIQGFANYYGIEIQEAKEIISKGKEIHHARFISAAPDLLEVLEAAVARVQIASEEGDCILSAWLPDALSAIAKAKGEK